MFAAARTLLAGFLALVLAAPAFAAMKADLIITNGLVVTMDKDRRLIEGGLVAVRDGRIIAVGPGKAASEFTAKEAIDAKGAIVMPGMINLHNHLSMVAFRGLGEFGIPNVEDRIIRFFFPLEKELLSRDLIRIAARQAAMESVLGGVTTVVDMYYHEDEVATALVEVGMRGVLGESVIGFPVVDAAEPYGGLQYAEKYIKEWQGHPLITPALAPHAPYTVSPEKLRETVAMARRLKAPVLLHMAEFASEKGRVAAAYKGTTENRSVIQYLDEIGFLGPWLIGAHVIYVDEADRAILKARGVGIAHNPKANTKDMSGLAPAWALFKEGQRIGLGTDGPMSSNQMDILGVMPFVARVARVKDNDVARFEPAEIVEMATLGGARGLHREKDLGSLEKGKRADIVIVDRSGAHMQPLYDVYAALVFQSYPTDVATTIVNGEVVVRDRRIVKVDLARHEAEWSGIREKVAGFAKTLK